MTFSEPSVVYLAGPIFGCDDEQCNAWRTEASRLLAPLAVSSPMVRDYRGLEGECFRQIVSLDLADIDKSDFVLANVSTPSWGTAMEVFYAYRANKPVVCFTNSEGAISPWIMCHAEAVYRNVEDACFAIRNYRVLGRRVF